jgi:small subunit ribosomal protein S18
MFKKTFSSSSPKPRGKFGDNKKREFRSGGPGGHGGPRFFQKKTCRFCADKNSLLDYKDTERLRKFLTEKGKIMPRRITGNCAKCQRMLTRAIKRSRHAGFVAFQID